MKRKLISVFIAVCMLFCGTGAFAYSDSEALAALDFSDVSFEQPNAVTLDLALMTEFKGQSVTWTSSNENVVTVTGKVTRPAVGQNSENVTLTAVIGTGSKTFNVTVLPFANASEVVTLAKTRLTFDKLSAEKTDGVTEALSLPATDEFGTVIRWESSDKRVLRIVEDGDNFKGEISRASFSDGNFSVFLTASMYYGDAYAMTRFYITVSEMDVSYKYSTTLSDIIDTFDYKFKTNNNIQALRTDLVLPEVDGATITYTSSDPSVISNDGKVTRSVEEDKTVYFTANLANGYENTHITYSVIVKPVGANEAADRLDEDLAWVVSQISSVNLASVTSNLELPETAPHGSKIEYTSSNPSVLGTDGKVTRSNSDVEVQLKIRVYFANESRETTVTVKIKKKSETGEQPSPTGGNTSPAPPSSGGTVTPIPSDGVKYTYSDVLPSHWAYAAVENLTMRGIVDGNDDGTFEPNSPITREAFVKMLVTAMNAEIVRSEVPFKDVKTDAWYYGYIATAAELGVVNGIENDFFGVGYNISRQDICTLIYRAFYDGETSEDAPCGDFGEVSDYAKNAVSVMYKNGILQGDDDGNFNPKNNASRAEVAAVFYRLQNK